MKLCACGCGEPAPIANWTDKRSGHVKGQSVRFKRGHNKRKHDWGYDVDADGCWIFRGHISKHTGYGSMGHHETAHCGYYKKYVGPIPEGLQIDHLCRVRSCVNPEHLEAVTTSENNLRGLNPERVRRQGYLNRKLTDEQVREIRASRETQSVLAKRHGVTQATISYARRGLRYKEVV